MTLTVKDVAGNVASVTHRSRSWKANRTPTNTARPLPKKRLGRPRLKRLGQLRLRCDEHALRGLWRGLVRRTTATTTPPVPGPVATQAVLSSSLRKTLSKGLVVRYSVNQQVTGHFEVLLAASIAYRLGLHLPLAAGLPAGTPPQVVIGKALLVTTKAGRNTLKIQFGKVTAARLRRLHNVSLMLRLTLRNAGGGTTTVLSKLTLR